MASKSSAPAKGGSTASNAALQDDEDTMNRVWRGKHFREWAKSKREKRPIGTPILYDKSPPPPPKK